MRTRLFRLVGSGASRPVPERPRSQSRRPAASPDPGVDCAEAEARPPRRRLAETRPTPSSFPFPSPGGRSSGPCSRAFTAGASGSTSAACWNFRHCGRRLGTFREFSSRTQATRCAVPTTSGWIPTITLDKKVVLIARHPGDIAVSRYHHLKHRSRDKARRRLADQPLESFVWADEGGIPSIVDLPQSVRGAAGRHDPSLRGFPRRSRAFAPSAGQCDRPGGRSRRHCRTPSSSAACRTSSNASGKAISLRPRLRPRAQGRRAIRQGPQRQKRRLSRPARSQRPPRGSTLMSTSTSIAALGYGSAAPVGRAAAAGSPERQARRLPAPECIGKIADVASHAADDRPRLSRRHSDRRSA